MQSWILIYVGLAVIPIYGLTYQSLRLSACDSVKLAMDSIFTGSPLQRSLEAIFIHPSSAFFGTVTAKWCHCVGLNLEGPHCTGPNRLTSAIYR
jgi:hypothetical protein